MVIHKEYALRRFCEVPLKHSSSKVLLEKMWQDARILRRVVFVTMRDYLPNTMLVTQEGAEGISFRLQLSDVEAESLTLANGKLLKEQQKVRIKRIDDPLQAWEALQSFSGLLHVQLVFKKKTPDWYGEIAVPNEAVPPGMRVPGFAGFIREQIDLLLWAITLKEEIDLALRSRDKERFEQVVPLYKEVCQSCFWQL